MSRSCSPQLLRSRGSGNPCFARVCFPGVHALSRSQRALTRGEECLPPDACRSLSPLLFDRSGWHECVLLHASIFILEQVFVRVKCFVARILGGGSRCAGVWLCRRLLGVAAPPWVPDRGRGRRFGRVPDVGNGRQVVGGSRAARAPPWVPGCPGTTGERCVVV